MQTPWKEMMNIQKKVGAQEKVYPCYLKFYEIHWREF